MSLFVISHHQAYALVGAHRKGQTTAKTSPDLTLTTVEATLDDAGVFYPDPWNIRLTWEQLEPIAKDETHCFKLVDGELVKIHTFSEVTNRAISLYPTAAAPTMVLAGFPMHRIKDTDPYRDTLAKIKAASPVSGLVLDTATGLGYTAIQAAKTAQQVYTCEIDPSVLEICAQNPWSQDLFNNPKITQLQGDAFDLIEEMDAGIYSRVIHDPPTVQLAGHLYSGDFYAEVYRVLKSGGRLFHYIGDPKSGLGSSMTRGVVKRLIAAGFRSVRPAPNAYGVIADK
jgi:predicted methyltransferase